MKATELRIGNWIEYNSFELGGFYQVEQICEDSEGFDGYYIKFRNGSFATSLEEEEDEDEDDKIIQPIPLTEEWLLKFGFELDIEDDGYQKGKYKVSVSDEGCLFFIYIGYYPEEIAEFKYVHQLQNLYHALTGKEIKLKEE